LTKNPTQHARTKHIDVQHHFVQKRVENGEVIFEYYSIEDMVADVLTKALPKK
jgi:methyl coenzyme M reductase subunit D